MGVERKIVTRGTGSGSPAAGDKVSIHYTGWLYDAKKSNKGFQGKQFDSSRSPGRGVFNVEIGTGQVIKGWDEGVMQMTLGEKAMLTISPDYGYGDKANGKIPAGSTLIFEVELLKINNKSA
ncbi:Peptidyl-prolyl cis-trans isomerase FKBP-type [Penicillium brevicompactum]|uniref:peptidylprolyl isomerase n=1 Tax=Penicillium brevicompactum TaxID=5074 RepID=A0A9W9QA35_PENBR|nr:Peptidyl-prolyl cis-trans isomerase FKBP-type [Penicillium brevicompactum]KAJ5328483.1 Peptidyl-prolyl cis-trans isomerase FKBP-type [Penicillium brevicompactum]KAJ5347706.1 Peptidyl-prolyl cis-trans isomerase FKBP-type [Penicillium brevicompactum]KAJ5367438.1 Peptidyl-prolyl cis-trans isomerase FKBP-type [Penicillium brevicompactum]